MMETAIPVACLTPWIFIRDIVQKVTLKTNFSNVRCLRNENDIGVLITEIHKISKELSNPESLLPRTEKK
jgi:sulfopyruvate decarboxylase TPP-binding subunit